MRTALAALALVGLIAHPSGADARQGRYDVQGRDDARASPRTDRSPYPDRYPSGRGRGRSGYVRVPFDNGYTDGYDKGREDVRERRAYDPVRHKRYRSADHGYDRRYGSKDQYKRTYRDGFQSGYDDAFREMRGYRDRRGGRSWPF